jgi:uncharacterized protein
MFIEFQVGNFRSFRDIQKFTMLASPQRPNDSGLNENNVFVQNGFRCLKTKSIYGANASGKSNLIKGITAFRSMVLSSVSTEGLTKLIWNDRFQLITNWGDQPVFFQYIFSLNDEIFRYGFQILNTKIIYEWLYKGENDTEVELFLRSDKEFNVNTLNFPSAKIFTDQIQTNSNELFRPDSLFLTVASLYSNKLASELRAEILKLLVVDGLYDDETHDIAINTLEHGTEEEKMEIRKLLKAADTGVEDIQLHKSIESLEGRSTNKYFEVLSDNNYEPANTLFSVHSRYDENGNLVDNITVPFMDWESEGTFKLLGIGTLVFRCLRIGGTLAIDEFDARFHPNLTLKIVNLFNSKKTNTKNAQLIFVTHDTGLLRRADFRRDQICLVNKDRYGISEINTLIEYKGVRKDSSFEKEYLNGSYSAVPFLDEIDWIIFQRSKND